MTNILGRVENFPQGGGRELNLEPAACLHLNNKKMHRMYVKLEKFIIHVNFLNKCLIHNKLQQYLTCV